MFEAVGVINIWVFFLGTLVIILAPGPNSLYVLATSMRFGTRDGYKAASAVLIGDAVLTLLASVGVDSVLRLYPICFFIIKYAGAAYLAYLGLRILYTELFCPLAKEECATPVAKENPFKKALLLSLSNPKAILFFVSFFVQFVDPGYAHTGLSFLVLGCIVQVVSFSYLSLLIIGGARLAAFFKGRNRLIRAAKGGVGAVFLGFGFRLALATNS